ncbi:hypothetical protein HYQ46_011802 [Verticillium longisporum]|nr:hypothetical protein HYQ46_011802 [Verticillium longisporum]
MSICAANNLTLLYIDYVWSWHFDTCLEILPEATPFLLPSSQLQLRASDRQGFVRDQPKTGQWRHYQGDPISSS